MRNRIKIWREWIHKKDMNKAFVDYVIRDYEKPLGVATYKTYKYMSNEMKKALPDVDDLKILLALLYSRLFF